MVVTLEEVKKYLRIDYDDEDELLNSLIEVAEIYISDAISNVKELEGDYREEARLKLLYCVLVRELFDNRENTEKGEFSYTVRTLITQLQTKQGD